MLLMLTIELCSQMQYTQFPFQFDALFSIFINSITNFITLTFYLYAHDLQIYTTTSINEIHSELRSTLMFNLSARGADFDYR